MTNRRQRRATLPKLPALPAPPRQGGGVRTARLPRERRTAEAQRPYNPPPPGYPYSINEWIVEDYLVRVKGWKKISMAGSGEVTTPVIIPQRSFYQQAQIRALGIFVNTDETRIDFLVPQGRGGGVAAIAIDPYDERTHPDAQLDLLKRKVLKDQERIDLIWLYGPILRTGNYELIEEALRGIDTSPRAHGG